MDENAHDRGLVFGQSGECRWEGTDTTHGIGHSRGGIDTRVAIPQSTVEDSKTDNDWSNRPPVLVAQVGPGSGRGGVALNMGDAPASNTSIGGKHVVDADTDGRVDDGTWNVAFR